MANKTENLNTLQIHKLSQAQYDAALAAGKIDDTAIYLTPDEDNFASQEEFDAKVAGIEKSIGDINIALGGKASKDITINDQPLTGNITLTHTDVGAAEAGHNHDTAYYKKSEIDATVNAINNSFYTKEEINGALAEVATKGHNHDDKYAAISTIDEINEDIKGINETIKNAGNWDLAYTHSTEDHAPEDAEKNTIVSIKVNDTPLTPDSNRAVNISMYTTEQIDAELAKKVDNTITINDKALTGNISLTYSDVGAADASAQENVIESIKVNDTALSITGKTVNIPVPTGALASKSVVAESDLDDALATKIGNKADKAETLAGYNIGDAYTSEEVDAAIKALEDGDVKTNKDNIATLMGNDTTEGSLAKAVTDVTTYIDQEIKKLADGDVKTNKEAIETLTGNDTTTGSLAKALKDAKEYADQQVGTLEAGQVKTNKEAIGTLDSLETTAKADLVTAINEVRNAVSVGGTAAAITMDISKTTEGALKSYIIKQGENTIGTIDIPKDMVVVSGTVEVDPTGQEKGTYIKLGLANVEEPLYINVGSLVDIYTAQESATQVQIAIDSSTRKISATIVAESITATELADDAVTTVKIADNNVTQAKLSTEVQTILGNVGTLSDQFDAFVNTTLPAHTGNTDVHVVAGEKDKWNAAKIHADSDHARADATKVEASTTNGNIKINDTETTVYAHPTSSVTAGTYKSVTVDAEGHITAGTNPTTLQGYSITDAYTSEEVDGLLVAKVDKTITINNRALSGNISLTYTDVGAAQEGHSHEDLTAADAALQKEIDALELLVGTLPEDTTATSITTYVKDYVDTKTQDIASNESFKQLNQTVTSLKGAFEAIDHDDYYTKDEGVAFEEGFNKTLADINGALGNKAEVDDVYTKSEVDALVEGVSGTDDHTHESIKIKLTDVNNQLGEGNGIGDTLNAGLLEILNRINAKADDAATTQALGLKAETSALTELETALKQYIDQQVAAKSLVQIVTWENVDENEENTEGAED